MEVFSGGYLLYMGVNRLRNVKYAEVHCRLLGPYGSQIADHQAPRVTDQQASKIADQQASQVADIRPNRKRSYLGSSIPYFEYTKPGISSLA